MAPVTRFMEIEQRKITQTVKDGTPKDPVFSSGLKLNGVQFYRGFMVCTYISTIIRYPDLNNTR